MATEHTLTTTLVAAQARLTANASTNPAGLSEGLVRQQELPEIDFAAETTQALDALETAVEEYCRIWKNAKLAEPSTRRSADN